MRFATTLLALALAAVSTTAQPDARTKARTFDFDTTPDRVWIGRDFWTNRLQDWRVAGHRVECLETRKNFPMRTAHLLTSSLGETPGKAEISVRLGALDPEAEPGPHAAAGLLIGAGSSHIDYRLSAQVHHAPAEDGGMAILVERDGSVSILRNDKPLDDSPLWSLNMPIGPEQMPVIGRAMPTPEAAAQHAYTLVVQVVRGETVARVTARTQDDAGNVLHFALAEVPHDLADGCIALAATGGPEGSPTGYWFDDLKISGDLVREHPGRAFGPVWHAMYTRSGEGIGMTAQLPPLAPMGVPTKDMSLPEVELWVDDSGWRKVASSPVAPDSWTANFVLPGWDTSRDLSYEVRFAEPTDGGDGLPGKYAGVFRATPDILARDYVIGSLSCNKIYTGGLKWNRMGLWFPQTDLVSHLEAQNPDMLFFAGDQIYEGDLTPPDRRSDDFACLDYLYKWTKWCWGFGAVTADRPTVVTPDDHDVYHGNLWGAGGRRAQAHDGMTAQDAGGYVMSPRFVNAVHRTQTSNLPPSKIDAKIGAGYTTFTTSFVDAGVSFAVFSDRMFKESPTPTVPAGKFKNGWPQAAHFNAATRADDPSIPLLGEQQEQFLRDWAVDWSHGAWMKVALSQSPFCAAHTLPSVAKSDDVVPTLPSLAPGEYPPDDRPAPDADSNGWPRSGRDRAVEALRRGFAIHLAGDQHLATLIQYGLDGWRDAGACIASPAIGNTWPRRWYPSEEGKNRAPGSPRNTGDFTDAFGNHFTMLAVADPITTGLEPARLYDKAPGYYIVRLNARTRAITAECWPRWADPAAGGECYPGWPITLTQGDNCGASWEWAIDGLVAPNLDQYILTVRRAGEEQPLYSIRVYDGFVPRVPDEGPWDWDYRIGTTGRAESARGEKADRSLDEHACRRTP